MKVEQVTMQLCIASGTPDWRQKVTDAVTAAGGILAVEVEGEAKAVAPIADGTAAPVVRQKRKWTRRAKTGITANPDHAAKQSSGTTTSRVTDDEGSRLEIRK